ncbi:MAG: hypothetical protein Q4A84_09695 [Neisseria sp.]|uniref:hypothetical protein n=1 Tax=Neisseria sp. TaxID=192066 RepID=UPI0026DB93BC|nr:hypothetical protein [Neisseria sp.]MDO4641951.1 hypothetical protein [Neisseria sp.]
MNKKTLLCASIFGLVLIQSAAARTSYICRLDGKAVYTTQKINASCQVSEMDGISEETVSINRTSTPSLAAAKGQTPETIVLGTNVELYGEPTFDFTQPNENDQITKIWEKEQFGSYDDVKIMPRIEDQKPADMNVKIRNQPFDKAGSPSGKANTRLPVNYIPAPVEAPKPKLTRKQILQREIASEQAALVRAQAQLAKARKAGGNTGELEQTVRDRLANVKAIQSELKRQ